MIISTDFISEFFPKYFIYNSTIIESKMVILNFSTQLRSIKCPTCGKNTISYATHYIRKIQDLPILDKGTIINIKILKMKCNNNNCEINYFNETLEDYVLAKKRYSNRLTDLLIKISLTETAEGGSRMLKEKNISVSGDKLLQLAKKFKPIIDKNKIISIGVDDFALKKT